MTAEDDLAMAVRARVDAAGGDASRIFARAWVKREDWEKDTPTIEDVDFLRRDIKKMDAALVIIDPLMAYLGLETNSYNDQQVRRALAPLARLAEEMDVAILLVRHLRKGGASNAIYAGGGSIGFAGAARSVLYCAKDPLDPDRRILASAKSNLSARPKSLVFRVVAAGDSSKVEWLGESEETADSLAAGRAERPNGALQEAVEFIKDLLKDGRVASKVMEEEAKGAGISMKTLNRAKRSLGIRPKRIGDGWWWLPPDDADEDGQDGQAG
jgi:hypothetical protein